MRPAIKLLMPPRANTNKFGLKKEDFETIEEYRKAYNNLSAKEHQRRTYIKKGPKKNQFGLNRDDFETIEGDGSITLRDRDTMKQQRLSEDEAVAYLEEKINP